MHPADAIVDRTKRAADDVDFFAAAADEICGGATDVVSADFCEGACDGVNDGVKAGAGNGASAGASDGASNGASVGASDGVSNGASDGASNGASADDDCASEQDKTSSNDSISNEHEQLVDALAKADELRDRYLRLQAEWDNFRKRTAAERADERNRATQNLVERLLPVVDDLKRAIEHAEITSETASDSIIASDSDSMLAGIKAVSSKLNDILGKEGLEVIDPKGQPFDANLHSAVGTVDGNGLDHDTVVEVYQTGYLMAGRVLRPAMVVVSK
jgi:molecular chaperone GrpE